MWHCLFAWTLYAYIIKNLNRFSLVFTTVNSWTVYINTCLKFFQSCTIILFLNSRLSISKLFFSKIIDLFICVYWKFWLQTQILLWKLWICFLLICVRHGNFKNGCRSRFDKQMRRFMDLRRRKTCQECFKKLEKLVKKKIVRIITFLKIMPSKNSRD